MAPIRGLSRAFAVVAPHLIFRIRGRKTLERSYVPVPTGTIDMARESVGGYREFSGGSSNHAE